VNERPSRPDVEIGAECFSSCANYLFPAGATQSITGLGVVAWHGNMSHMLDLHARGSKPLAAADLAEVQRQSVLEKAFYASIGLDEYLCWFGKIGSYNARNLYFLHVPDMARFGISGVSVRPGYEHTDVSR
jgi:hypothetical protein